MAAVKIATWVFVFLVGAIAVYLAWNNRGSEKVATNFPTALAVSAVGALLTLLFSLHAEDKRAEFPVEYVIDTQTRRPFQCEFFPECTQYTDAGALTVFPAWLAWMSTDKSSANVTGLVGG